MLWVVPAVFWRQHVYVYLGMRGNVPTQVFEQFLGAQIAPLIAADGSECNPAAGPSSSAGAALPCFT